MKAITLNYKYSGYRGQFFSAGSLYDALMDLQRLGVNTGTGTGLLKEASGVCGKFTFNFILN
jgi:hypothetical protein